MVLIVKKEYLQISFVSLCFFIANGVSAASVQEQMDQSPQVKAAIIELVLANHILYDQNAVDGYGHISIRNPINPNTFFLARSVAPSLAQISDVMEFDMDGKALNGDTRVAYGERFIHSGILRNRPDINSVVHGHAASILPYGLTHGNLKPVYHMSAFLGEGTPIFEIREFAQPSPDTDMFISNPTLGQALAKTMDQKNFVLMRGHGYAAAGESIRQVVFRSVYAIQNAAIQTEASKMGKVQYLTAEEAKKSQATIEKTINRPWELWSLRVGGK